MVIERRRGRKKRERRRGRTKRKRRRRRRKKRSTKEYKGRTDSNSPTGPNEAVCVAALLQYLLRKRK